MPNQSNAERERLLDRDHLSRPPLRLVVPIAVISLLVVGAGTALVLAQDGGGTGAATGQNASADEPTRTVEVGPDNEFVFEPGTGEPLRIEPGTTVTFEWKSDDHNIVVGDQPSGANWAGHERLEGTGYSTTHTFETNGTYEFYSEPYRAIGMIGEIVVGQPETSDGPIDATNATNVTVGPNGELGFEPSGDEPLVVESGTTVTFEWGSDGHNLVVEEQPEGADWNAHREIEDTGYSTTHTFTETGVYEFVCEPHESVGATGTIVVVDGSDSK